MCSPPSPLAFSTFSQHSISRFRSADCSAFPPADDVITLLHFKPVKKTTINYRLSPTMPVSNEKRASISDSAISSKRSRHGRCLPLT